MPPEDREPPGTLVYEDEDLIAVDKPEGVPSQAADPAHPDDLPSRLKAWLAARDGGAPYLGTHQRLDRDTSGVLLYTKAARANAELARQLEGRRVGKRYVAIVEGWRGGDRTLTSHLARGEGGRTAVVSSRDRRAKVAVTHVAVRARRGDRAALDITIETGRTHQIRAQLAAEGAPILGDALYGGAPAPRLMLHAARLALTHPCRGTPLVIEAPPPPIFEALLEGTYAPLSSPWLEEALARAAERRWGLAHRGDTDAYRLVNEAGDGLPGLAVDRYGRWLVAHLYDPALERDAVLDALHALGFAGVYVKRRPRQANVIVDGRDDSVAPSAPLRGEAAPETIEIEENGLVYRVRLGEGLSTGLFLDQRENRARVRALAAGRRVLNLFAYTCGFTLAAAAGGARETLSVDASRRLLAWGEENLGRAGFSGDAHRVEARDVFEALEALARAGTRFDLVCVDPPTYSRTRSGRWTSGKDWERLGEKVLRVVAPDGVVLATSNDRRMRQRDLRQALRRAADRAGVVVAQLKDLPCPADFPAPAGQEPHLKSALLTLASLSRGL